MHACIHTHTYTHTRTHTRRFFVFYHGQPEFELNYNIRVPCAAPPAPERGLAFQEENRIHTPLTKPTAFTMESLNKHSPIKTAHTNIPFTHSLAETCCLYKNISAACANNLQEPFFKKILTVRRREEFLCLTLHTTIFRLLIPAGTALRYRELKRVKKENRR